MSENECLSIRDPGNLVEKYIKIKELGSGTFGKVYEIENKETKKKYACKHITKKKICDMNKFNNEINIMREINHPNIIKLYEIYEDQRHIDLVMEECLGGELFDRIMERIQEKKIYNEKEASIIFKQIMKGVEYCHSKGIVHRDLKPENILFLTKEENSPIKIIDFGLSKIFGEKINNKFLSTKVGTAYYVSPEILEGKYNEKCDIWSCGVILYIILSGTPPFNGENDIEIYKKISHKKFTFPEKEWQNISENAKDLIKKMLTIDVNKRINAEEVLNHPWFKENQSKELFAKVNNTNTIKDLISNLKRYKRTSVIQETALAYLVRHFPHIKDVVNACKLFNQIDHSADGKITKEELYNGINALYKSSTLKADIDQIFKNLDMDNDGYIGYEEFVRGAVNKEYFIQPNILKFAFRYFDKDDSGEITLDEIKELFYDSIPDKKQVNEYIDAIIKEVDLNNDKKVSFDEFSDVMKTMIKQ